MHLSGSISLLQLYVTLIVEKNVLAYVFKMINFYYRAIFEYRASEKMDRNLGKHWKLFHGLQNHCNGLQGTTRHGKATFRCNPPRVNMD